MLRNCCLIVRLLPASILTMSKFGWSLKRKSSDSSEMNYAGAVKHGKTSQSGPSAGRNTGHVNQGIPVKDDRKNEQPYTEQRQPNWSGNNRGTGPGHQGANSQPKNRQLSGNAGSHSNQSWNKVGKGGKKNRKGRRGKDGAYNESYGRNMNYDNKKSTYEFEEPESVYDYKQRQDSHRKASATNTAQRSRQNSESKDNSATSSKAPIMSRLPTDTSTQPSFSGTPTKARLPPDFKGMNNQANLTLVPPPSYQAGMPVTPVKDLSLSDPAVLLVCQSQEQMDSLKKPPGLSGADSGADGKKTSGFKSEDTVRRNIGPDLKDTKKLESQQSGKSKSVWKGVPLSQLKRAPECYDVSPSSQAAANESADHHSDVPESQESIDFKFRIVPSFVLLPHQQTPEDIRQSSRWQNIVQILSADIFNYWGLEEALTAIAYHNPLQSPQRNRSHSPQRYPNEKLDFRALQAYFKTLTQEELNHFFNSTLPKIKKLALELPYLIQKPLPILKQRVNQAITLSQHQAACLLANAFFNTFPQRPYNQREGKPLQMPDFNFIGLYSQVKSERKVEKLKCIINYFERVTEKMPDGNVTYKRVYSHPAIWQTNEKKLTNLHVSCEGTIEDARGFLQADFANKYVGGGVLTAGLVQEEIRFVLCPEMIVSRLFTEMLTSDEVLVMIGCERFNSYSGYSDTFKFTGNYFDDTERDRMGRRYTEVVAMDAAVFRDNYYQQFELQHVQRELNKAYIAFESKGTRNKPAVCTGNWGCGAFGGDKQLKALIQLMAASEANRDICYLTFGDTDLCLQIGHMYDILKARDICIKDIMVILKEYSHSNTNDSVFTFIEKKLTGNTERPEKPARSDFPKNENVQSKSSSKK